MTKYFDIKNLNTGKKYHFIVSNRGNRRLQSQKEKLDRKMEEVRENLFNPFVK